MCWQPGLRFGLRCESLQRSLKDLKWPWNAGREGIFVRTLVPLDSQVCFYRTTKFGTRGEEQVSRAQPRHPSQATAPQTFWDLQILGLLDTPTPHGDTQQPNFIWWSNHTKGKFLHSTNSPTAMSQNFVARMQIRVLFPVAKFLVQ